MVMESAIKQAIEQVPALMVLAYISYTFVQAILRLNETHLKQLASRDEILKNVSEDFSAKTATHNTEYSVILRESVSAQRDMAIALDHNTSVIERLTDVIEGDPNGKHSG